MDWPLRILHVIGRIDGYGGAHMLRRLAERQADAGARVFIAALAADAASAETLKAEGIAVRQFRSRAPADPLALARLSWAACRADADVIHAWGFTALATSTLGRRRDSSTAVVATVDAAPTRRLGSLQPMRWIARRVDALVGVDGATRDSLKRLGVDDERVLLIKPGVSVPSAAGRDRETVLREASMPLDVPLIAVAGPLVRRKAIDEAIWCFELVRVLYPQACMLIIGDGPDRARLERFAEQVSEPGFVRFLGFRQDVAELLQHVDVYWQVNASATTPWALLEAMAAGRPVVADDVPAHRAVVVDGQNGFLTPPGGRAEIARVTDQLLKDPATARRIGEAAAATIGADWSLDAALEAYRSAYSRAMARRAATK